MNAKDFATSEWSLIDESPDGFRLRFIKGEQWHVAPGDVVALQPRETSRIHVCMVRRVTTLNNQLELGLQLLSPQTGVAEVIAADASVKRALLLYNLPAHGRCSGLIVAPGVLACGNEVTLHTPGKSSKHTVARQLEHNDELAFFAIEPPLH